MAAASTQETRPGFLARLLGASDARARDPLYTAIVAEARKPVWYAELGIRDTIDGRFDMVTLVLSLVLLRLEREGDAARTPSVRLTEHFIEDMDGQMREIGFGDLVVGKRVSALMSLLGGRLGAYRDAWGEAALARNLWRGDPPAEPVRSAAIAAIEVLRAEIDAAPLDALLAGRLR